MSNSENRLDVAIIGSGPAGFYAAEELLMNASGITVRVDMLDRLATPWGLVQAGVARDHPKIKFISRVYEQTAEHAIFRFFGNVEAGVDLTHADLGRHYHAVVYAVGASTDRHLGFPGDDLSGSHAATEFVGWYNGHHDYADHVFDLSGKRAIVVGNGSVALDVARMSVLTPEELSTTDTADHALQALAVSSIEEIVILGRRGPVQAAFTDVELREPAEPTDADTVVDPSDMEVDEHSTKLFNSGAAEARVRCNVEVLQRYSTRKPAGKPKRNILQFFMSPLEVQGDDRVTALRAVRNVITLSPGGDLIAAPTGHTETIAADLVLRSIGYRGLPIEGIPFAYRLGTILNSSGRVRDSNETVEGVLEDAAACRLLKPEAAPDDLMKDLLRRGIDVVDYAGWQAIDSYERRLGEFKGRDRVELLHYDEVLSRSLGRPSDSNPDKGACHRQPVRSRYERARRPTITVTAKSSTYGRCRTVGANLMKRAAGRGLTSTRWRSLIVDARREEDRECAIPLAP